MAWTATIRQPAKSRGEVIITVDFTDGVDTVTKEYHFQSGDLGQLKQNVQSEIQRLSDLDVFYEAVRGDVKSAVPAGVVSEAIDA